MDEDLREAGLDLYARLLAIQASVLALISALPKTPTLPGILEEEIEKYRNVLLANPVSDKAIDSYDQQLVAICNTVRRYHG